jgi:hypothetical protein
LLGVDLGSGGAVFGEEGITRPGHGVAIESTESDACYVDVAADVGGDGKSPSVHSRHFNLFGVLLGASGVALGEEMTLHDAAMTRFGQ